MQKIITLSGIKAILLKRLKKGFLLSQENRDQLDEYFKLKEEAVSKGSFEGGEDLSAKRALKEAYDLLHFIQKEDLQPYELPDEIHPAGVLNRGLLIEPISKYHFFYNWCGIKGIAEAKLIPDSRRWYIELEDTQIWLEDPPIKNHSYKLPDFNMVKRFLEGRAIPKDTKTLFKTLETYFKTFMDIEKKGMYKILAIYPFLSFLQESFDVLFYLGIDGQYGGGKTTLGELLAGVCRHGYATSNLTVAFLARVLDSQRLTLFIDELDTVNIGEDQDHEIFAILRQGYRRGLPFSRIGKDNREPESFNVFGCKMFSIHDKLEQALLTRSIPITLQASPSKALPIINTEKRAYSKRLLDELYLWYFDSAILLLDKVYVVDVVDHIIDRYIYKNKESEAREAIRLSLMSNIPTPSSLGLLDTLRGRNLELGFILSKLDNMLGIGLIESSSEELLEIFRTKEEMEKEKQEMGVEGDVRDILKEFYVLYHDKPEYRTEFGYFKIAQKEVISKLKERVDKASQHLLNHSKIRGTFTEIGFIDGETKRRMKIRLPLEKESRARLCLIYSPKILENLGLGEEAKENV